MSKNLPKASSKSVKPTKLNWSPRTLLIKLVTDTKNSFAYFQKKPNRFKKGPKISVENEKPNLQGLVASRVWQIFKRL